MPTNYYEVVFVSGVRITFRFWPQVVTLVSREHASHPIKRIVFHGPDNTEFSVCLNGTSHELTFWDDEEGYTSFEFQKGDK